MEIADCKVRLSNDVNNIVFKEDVTPAEVVVLRAIHGPGSVFDIKVKAVNRNNKSINKRSHVWEMNRLRQHYNKTPGASPESEFQGGTPDNFDGQSFNIVSRLFPGVNPTLPLKFADVEIRPPGENGVVDSGSGEDPDDEEVGSGEAPVARRRRRSAIPAVAGAGEAPEEAEEKDEE